MAMKPPQTLWGDPVVWRPGIQPHVTTLSIAGITIARVRWDLRDVAVQGFEDEDPTTGHVVTYLVNAGDPHPMLSQQGSVFYQEELAPAPGRRTRKIAQGDGVNSPRWYKSDRGWPADGETPYHFIGQASVDGSMIYLFRHPELKWFAIFEEWLDCQDVEEHYREEERRLNR